MGNSGAYTGGTGSGLSGPVSSTDNALVRWDGTDATAIQSSLITQSDIGGLAGCTQLDVDNLRLDGNTLSITNTNGPLILSSNGTSGVGLGGSSSSFPGLYRQSSALDVRTADGLNMTTVIASQLATVASVGGPGQWKVLSNGDVVARASAVLKITNGGDTNATVDTGMVRDGPGVWRDTDGSAGLGSRLTGRVVEASTSGLGSPNLLTVAESRKLLTNEGAVAEAYNVLPLAAAGVGPFGFYCHNTNGIRAVANTGDTIRIEGVVSAAAGFIRSVVVGSLIWLECINATEWVASCKPAGTWTIDT